jgi:hypothetical protein
MRALYEGYAEALGAFLHMPLPPWIADHANKDNWMAVAKLRAKTEAANASPDQIQAQASGDQIKAIASFIDKHHDF